MKSVIKAYRLDILCALTLMLINVALWSPRLRGPLDLRYDAGVYYILGTSIAEGQGYRLLNEPGNPEAVQYPPLLPAIVAVHQKVAGTNDPEVIGSMMRKSFMVMSALSVLVVYALSRQFLTIIFASAATLLFVLNKECLFLSDLLFAETPFTLVTTLFFLLGFLGQRQTRLANKGAFFVGTTLLAWAAYALRSAGIAVVVAWVAESVLKRRWKQAALRAAVCAIPILAWQSYISGVTHSNDYVNPAYTYQRAAYQFYNVTYARNVSLIDPFKPEMGYTTPAVVAHRLMENIIQMPYSLGQSVSSKSGYWVKMHSVARRKLHTPMVSKTAIRSPALILGLLTIAGIVWMATRREVILPIYIVGTLGLICLTPWPAQAIRYLVPLVPFLSICLVFLLARIFEKGRVENQKGWTIGGLAIAGLIVCGIATQIFALAYTFRHDWSRVEGSKGRLFHYDDSWIRFDRAMDWVSGHAKPTDVIATSAPHWLYLKIGFKAVMPPMEVDSKVALDLLDSAKAKYVIVDEFSFVELSKTYTHPALESDSGRWKRVFTVDKSETGVYERLP